MDTFSHALWGATIIRKKPLVWWALVAGAGPDLLSSGPATLYLLLVRGKFWSQTTWELLPDWLHYSYHLAHSLVGAGIIFIILLLLGKRWIIFILPYLLHLVLDYLSHSGDVIFRMLFPFLSYSPERIGGFDWWTEWWVWTANIVLLLLVNLYLWRKKKRVM